MSKPILQFEQVSLVYANGFCAVQNVNFTLEKGECLAIVGESGSGKTTLARAALGILPRNTKVSGSIKIG
ncbi:MAG: ATP-binding cassette domain-containing protein, partial [Acidobacteriota bacterium]|nr:ATP-binding cassette domain-containing protein [Acidobacteriota bacterium]